MLTLSSDFGSPYPAAMKGVLLQLTDARLVDVSHDFPRQDVQSAAFWLREVLPYFPPAVHLVVVDPGVGTDRKSIVVDTGDHELVGPDNGVLLPVARRLARADGGAEEDLAIYEIPIEDPDSATFHGRDVFAPAAATVHETPIDQLDYPAIDEYVDLRFPDPETEDERARGEVLVVDGFGNAITNIPGAVLQGCWGEQIRVNDETAPVRRTYAEVATGGRLVTVGSHGNVELSVNQGRGDEAFGLGVGDSVDLDLEQAGGQ